MDVDRLAYDAGQTAPLHEDDGELDRRVQAAAHIARQYSGPPRADIDSSGDARVLRERTLRRQMPDRYGYRPGRAIIDVGAIVARDEQGLHYQGGLREAYRADEVRMLIEADEARLIPNGVISYPRDWPERMRRRQKYAGGMIARSASWHDKDGREWYVAIYDIHDLIYVPPQFDIGYGFGAGSSLRNALIGRPCGTTVSSSAGCRRIWRPGFRCCGISAASTRTRVPPRGSTSIGSGRSWR